MEEKAKRKKGRKTDVHPETAGVINASVFILSDIMCLFQENGLKKSKLELYVLMKKMQIIF